MVVTQRRTMENFVHQMRWLVDEAYPETPVVRLFMDNLNTQRPASLYETLQAAEARRVAKRLEFHYTPKHGSWLTMAEIEFSVLSRSCLKQHLLVGSRSGGKSMFWLRNTTPPKPLSTGGSTPKMPQPNFTAFTLLIPRLTDF